MAHPSALGQTRADLGRLALGRRSRRPATAWRRITTLTRRLTLRLVWASHENISAKRAPYQALGAKTEAVHSVHAHRGRHKQEAKRCLCPAMRRFFYRRSAIQRSPGSVGAQQQADRRWDCSYESIHNLLYLLTVGGKNGGERDYSGLRPRPSGAAACGGVVSPDCPARLEPAI